MYNRKLMVLYDSLTRKKQELSPINKNKVTLYVCGITPYDTTHIGHAFTYVVFDVLVRYLNYKNILVEYTQNVTDIDDDILKRAEEEKKDWKELGDYWTNRYLADLVSLNVKMPTHFVKATDSIPSIVKITKVLLEKNYAYIQGGNIYFDTAKFPDYGKLSHYNKNQMILISKERGADPNDPHKKNPLDFILWQKTHKGPSWESPWGKGRPGWHIECSAMIHDTLGDHIDIHGGGRDLIYPHHESEIAQSESYTGNAPFVNNWMHISMLMYQGEKMSKSLGNLIMVSDLLKSYSANAVRLALLFHHYRMPWEFDEAELESSESALLLFNDALRIKSNRSTKHQKNRYLKLFEEALLDDLDTPLAIDHLVTLANRILKEKNKSVIHNLQQALHTGLSILGIPF